MKMRFAPSPTGYMHIANARTALLNWLMCQQNGGDFILRIDDTDVERSKQEYIDQIKDDLAWFGVRYSECFQQSKRMDLYHLVIEKLKEAGIVYPAYETAEELQEQRQKQLALGQPPIYKPIAQPHDKPHWRFRLTANRVQWEDLIMGHMDFSGSYASDPVVMREDGTLTYILASIIDDYDMRITHIVRGNDHVSNTAVQLNMLKSLDKVFGTKTRIVFGHFPLVSDLSGKIFSKRDNSLAIKNLRHLNPEIVTRFLVELGMSTKAGDMSESHLNQDRAPETIYAGYGKGNIKCDIDQLFAQNAAWIAHLDYESAEVELGVNMDEAFWQIAKYNIGDYNQAKHWQEIFDGKTFKLPPSSSQDLSLQHSIADLIKNTESWAQALEFIKPVHPNLKISEVAQLIRYVLTGSQKGASMQELFEYFGTAEIARRLKLSA